MHLVMLEKIGSEDRPFNQSIDLRIQQEALFQHKSCEEDNHNPRYLGAYAVVIYF